MTIDNSEAQSLLNVESSISGLALQKRKGYVRSFSLTVASSPVNGSYSFVDTNGNRQDIVCHDHYCSKSTNGAAFVVFLSSGGGASPPTRWSFADIGGKLYGANDRRDSIFQYDGTTLSWPLTMPKGAVLELTKSRLAIADVASSPNSVYYSQSGTYTNFTTGLLSTDPYVDSMGSNGDRVTALKYALGRLYIFKPISITACVVVDQYTSSCYPVSNAIGTSDPNSIVEIPGAILFRGTDKNFWQLDYNGLSLLSKKITNLILSQNQGITQSNTQTSKADWDAGTQYPSGSWDTTSQNGSIFPSSNTLLDNTTASFNLGTHSGTGALLPTDISAGGMASKFDLMYQADNGITPHAYSPAWTESDGGAGNTVTMSQSTCTLHAGNNYEQELRILTVGTTVPNTVIVYAQGNLMQSGASSLENPKARFGLYDSVGLVPRAYVELTTAAATYIPTWDSKADAGAENTFSTYTIVITTRASSSDYLTVRFFKNGVFRSSGTVTGNIDSLIMYVNNGSATPPAASDLLMRNFFFAHNVADPGNVNISGTPTFVSRIYDTTFSTPISGPFTMSWSTPTTSAVAMSVRSSTSPNNDLWTAYESVTPGNRTVTTVNRYWQYKAVFSPVNLSTTAIITNVSLTASTTGEYKTQCISAGNPTTAWGLLNCASTLAGAGSIVYFATSAVTCAAMPATSPSNWTSVSNNANLSIAVSSAVTIGFKSLLNSATDQAQIDACTLYWANGPQAPPSWGTYNSLNHAVYWTTAINNSATNNRVLKYDIKLQSWYPWDLNANAIRNMRSVTYFGDSTGGYWNTYGTVDSDNSAAINAYWISKDFSGGQPFRGKHFKTLSLVAKNQVTGSMNVTYTTSNNQATTYSVSLSTTAGQSYVRANRNLNLASSYEFININLGNNAAQYFEVDGLGIDFDLDPWRPVNP